MRKKLDEVDKKVKTGITLNTDIIELMDEHIKGLNTNRSRYIEKLIRDDVEKENKK